MNEGRGYRPEEVKNQPPKTGRLRELASAGILAFGLLKGVGIGRESKKDAPIASAERENVSVSRNDRKPLLLDSKPDWEGEDRNRLMPEEIEGQDEVEAQRLEKVARAQDMIDLLGENYGSIFTVDCDSDGVCKVSLKEGLPGATVEDLHVFDFRFDESGTCYVKEIIAGEESVIVKESGTKVTIGNREMETEITDGPDQEKEFLSVVGQFMGDSDRLDDEVRNQILAKIEQCFAQGKTIENIIDELTRDGIVEESTLEDLLHDLFMAYYEETREDKYNYKEKLQNFFTQEDKV